MNMKKIFSIFCVMGLLLCNGSAIHVKAVEVEEPCTEIVEEPYSWLVNNYNLTVSNYNGSLCVNALTVVSSVVEEVGLKDLTIQYSYNNSDWYNEWNAGKFCAYNTDEYILNNYIMALERHNCYYRITCKHYAKESFWSTQYESNTSNSVWIS